MTHTHKKIDILYMNAMKKSCRHFYPIRKLYPEVSVFHNFHTIFSMTLNHSTHTRSIVLIEMIGVGVISVSVNILAASSCRKCTTLSIMTKLCSKWMYARKWATKCRKIHHLSNNKPLIDHLTIKNLNYYKFIIFFLFLMSILCNKQNLTFSSTKNFG